MKHTQTNIFLDGYSPDNRAPSADPDGGYHGDPIQDGGANAKEFIRRYDEQADAFIYGGRTRTWRNEPMVSAADILAWLDSGGQDARQETAYEHWLRTAK